PTRHSRRRSLCRPHVVYTLFFSLLSFFFNDTATTAIYTLSLHDALPIYDRLRREFERLKSLERMLQIIAADDHAVVLEHHAIRPDRKSTRLNSSHVKISYAVFCLKKKKINSIRFS